MTIIEGLCELSDKNMQIKEWPFKFLVLCTVWWAHNSDTKGLNLLQQYQTHLALNSTQTQDIWTKAIHL